MMYKMTSFSKVLTRGNKVILCNVQNGSYIKTNKIYFEEINKIVNRLGSLSVDQLPDNIDKNNAKLLFSKLIEIDFYTINGLAKQNKLNIAFLAITNRCNLKCIHCSAMSKSDNIDNLSNSEIFNIIDQIDSLDVPNINITGGEPLIRNDIKEILKYSKVNYKGKVTLSTNGLLINNDNIYDIVNCVNEISISLDGYDEETCMKIRGMGVFNKVLKKIELIKSTGFSHISLSMTSSKFSENNEDKFYTLCSNLNVKPLIHRFTPNGRGAENEELLFTESIYKEIDLNIRPKLCYPGQREIFINSDGDIYPCGNLTDIAHLRMGNIKENEIAKIIKEYSDKNVVENYRPWNADTCDKCDVNLFCHSCISNILNVKQNKNLFNKMCNITYKELTAILWNTEGGENDGRN